MPVVPTRYSQEAFLGLKRHFLGVLSEPSRVSIASDELESLLFTSRGALRKNGAECLLDFGAVDSPGQEHQHVRISVLSAETVAVVLHAYPPWLVARWTEGDNERLYLAPGDRGAEFEIVVEHDLEDRELREGVIELTVTELSGRSRKERFGVRLTARQTYACGVYDFAGKPEPHPYDFGVLDVAEHKIPGYAFAFRNSTAVPLLVSFRELPRWLAMEVDGFERKGPIVDTFFERAAPFKVRLRPVCIPSLLGSHRGSLTIVTNDVRPQFRTMKLDLAVRIRTRKALIPVDDVPAVTGDQPSSVEFAPEVSFLIPVHRGSAKASSTKRKDLLAALGLAVIVLIVLIVILIQSNS